VPSEAENVASNAINTALAATASPPAVFSSSRSSQQEAARGYRSSVNMNVAGDLPAGSAFDETEPAVVGALMVSSGTYPTFPDGVTIRTKYDPSCRGASPAPGGSPSGMMRTRNDPTFSMTGELGWPMAWTSSEPLTGNPHSSD
jgi:hypothetical protein